MLRLDLDSNEVAALIAALESYVSDLRMEIVDTEAKPFREDLKQSKDLLNQILEKLKAVPAES